MITARALGRLDAAKDLAVAEASGGEEALDRLAELLDGRRPVLVLSDYVMPGLDGLELAERVRRDHPGAPVHVAIFSSMARPPKGRLEDAARVRFLEKPMDLSEYRAQLDRIVEEWLDLL